MQLLVLLIAARLDMAEDSGRIFTVTPGEGQGVAVLVDEEIDRWTPRLGHGYG